MPIKYLSIHEQTSFWSFLQSSIEKDTKAQLYARDDRHFKLQ